MDGANVIYIDCLYKTIGTAPLSIPFVKGQSPNIQIVMYRENSSDIYLYCIASVFGEDPEL